MARPSAVVKEQKKKEKQEGKIDSTQSMEFEKTLRRLVNAVFDLQKDISKIKEQVGNVDSNIEQLRDQFQDFAEKTQQQLGVMIPAKQFKTAEEHKEASIETDIKGLMSELRSVEQLREYVEKRHESGAMPDDSYNEEIEKLDDKLLNLEKKLAKKRQELAELKS